jgi:galactokinase
MARQIEIVDAAIGHPEDIMSLSFSAPGRVNLIGEHTDYTGGLVMPMAIPFTTTASICAAKDGNYRFSTDRFEHARTMVPQNRSAKTGDWSDYPVGVLRELQASGIEPPPFELRLSGNVPLGAGLSSSASIEVATAMALLAYCGKTMHPEEIARLCQRAENSFVGSPCGIMDQFVVTSAVAGSALLLNTRDLSYELLPMNRGALGECRLLVVNSGVKHSIAGGDYGLRRRELEAGQAVLLRKFPLLRDLGDATLEQLASCERDMSAKSFKRCRHVVSENMRVQEAGRAMLAADPVRLGAIMTEAHASERNDFECSIEEVDFLVATAIDLDGCYGARLTGGGFGGCTVNLVRAHCADSIAAELRSEYRKHFGLDAEIYVCDAVDGAIKCNQPAQANPTCGCAHE